ncbi:LacI family DNA-binding transcriptional regulator [Salipaludibacillus daqingensis]|uniref:LacI family DNA-binding transcriptional regulator n=1 Tax=Salipaludibacillus daqingensis TaxID=3041001 RepID=UPI002475CE40|nr:LacI family DNA-binding transcriptional regulator [Salipaludibacillus daqingensis]
MEKPSIKDVAEKAGVSIATVSNVVNKKGRVSEKMIDRVQSIISEMGYSPNISARGLKQQQSYLIGVIVPFQQQDGNLQDNPFYWNLVSGIELGARNEKFHVILSGINEENADALDFVKDRHLDGLVIVGTYEDSPITQKINQLNIPCVYIDSYLKDKNCYEVYLDDEKGAYEGTKYLLNHGHQNIAVISGELEGGVTTARLRGHIDALNKNGLLFSEENHIVAPVSIEGGLHTANQILALKDISAIFCFSDVTAFGVMKGLHDLGVNIPEDLSIMGFDDLYFSKYLSPPLTTISQDIILKGKTATELLIGQIDHKVNIERKNTIPIKIMERNSIKPFNDKLI